MKLFTVTIETEATVVAENEADAVRQVKKNWREIVDEWSCAVEAREMTSLSGDLDEIPFGYRDPADPDPGLDRCRRGAEVQGAQMKRLVTAPLSSAQTAWLVFGAYVKRTTADDRENIAGAARGGVRLLHPRANQRMSVLARMGLVRRDTRSPAWLATPLGIAFAGWWEGLTRGAVEPLIVKAIQRMKRGVFPRAKGAEFRPDADELARWKRMRAQAVRS